MKCIKTPLINETLYALEFLRESLVYALKGIQRFP